MSWWVSLIDPSKVNENTWHRTVEVRPFTEGGTYTLGGSTDASLNITYNYTPFYYKYLDREKGIRWLHGKVAATTKTRLRGAIAMLGVDRDDDYWKATAGNAGHALSILLEWAKLHPSGIWEVH